jgi:hypothetical protein
MPSIVIRDVSRPGVTVESEFVQGQMTLEGAIQESIASMMRDPKTGPFDVDIVDDEGGSRRFRVVTKTTYEVRKVQ